MILAGDIGGTSTRLGLFDPARPRPRPLAVKVFTTLDFPDLPSMVAAFFEAGAVDRAAIDRACFGVAGPVVDDAAKLTHVPWRIDGRAIEEAFGLKCVRILNDLVAMAHAVPVLEDTELHTLQRGEPIEDGNITLIAAGTGLGVALLHNVGGRLVPSPSESGHTDFAARTEREIALLRDLTARFGRAEVEYVVAGKGLVNIHRVAHRGPCAAGVDLDDADAPAEISKAALERRCGGCAEVLEFFVESYGAEAGNLALGMMATGGVYIGGGIAPKILPALETGTFLKAFRAKGTFESMLEKMPVKIILNDEAGLLGAAVFGAEM
ncbi:MAG TPA: glucokinase [Vicinamibacterales bacterium]|jgi:glucokinase